VGLAPYDSPAAAPTATSLSCERIHMSPTSGVCLAVKRGVATTAEVLLLDGEMAVQHRLKTPGIPSRARVSADGLWAATTTFVYGHSYADADFSTQTEIYDVSSGKSLGNVEKWDITYNGEKYTNKDVNVWGVTFAPDGDSFYATIRTEDTIHLAEGSISGEALTMTDVPAECPSLSPSGEKLAFKSSTGPGTWQVKVRTLADGSEAVIQESRNVDDQIEWWDDQTVLYGLARAEGSSSGATADVWAAPADGSGESQLLVPQAWSPAVVRAS
jgi:Tol biopolymer transport system component